MVRRLGAKSAPAVAADYALSVCTFGKWKRRYAEGSVEALADASSRPKRCRCPLTEADMARIRELRIGQGQSRITHTPVERQSGLSEEPEKSGRMRLHIPAHGNELRTCLRGRIGTIPGARIRRWAGSLQLPGCRKWERRVGILHLGAVPASAIRPGKLSRQLPGLSCMKKTSR